MENELKARPLGDRVLVKKENGEQKTSSGIILQDSSTRGECVFGEVLSVGPGIYTQTGDRIPMSVKPGNMVMYKRDMAGEVIKLNGTEYLMFREHDLMMVIE